MSYYSIDDQSFWDSVTPPKLEYLREAGSQSGFGVAALPLGDPVAGDPPLLVMLKFAPNGVLIRHAHHCHRIEILVQGTLTTPDGTILSPGAVMTSGPGMFYGPHVAGPEGAVTAELFSSTYAKIDYVLDDVTAPPEAVEAMKKLAVQMDAAREQVGERA